MSTLVQYRGEPQGDLGPLPSTACGRNVGRWAGEHALSSRGTPGQNPVLERLCRHGRQLARPIRQVLVYAHVREGRMCRSVHVPHNPSRQAPQDSLPHPYSARRCLAAPRSAGRLAARPEYGSRRRRTEQGLPTRRARTRSRRAGEVQSSDSENVCNAPPGKGCNKAGVGSDRKILDDLATENRWT